MAQASLGRSYVAEKKDELAVQWFRKSARQGFYGGQNDLGSMYRDGKGGLPQSYALAVEWYKRGADQEYQDSQFNLGTMYVRGEGVPVNMPMAITLLRKAEAQGGRLGKEAKDLLQYVVRARNTRQEASRGGCARTAELATAAAAGAAGTGGDRITSPVPVGALVAIRGHESKKFDGKNGIMLGFDFNTKLCTLQLEDGSGPHYVPSHTLYPWRPEDEEDQGTLPPEDR